MSGMARYACQTIADIPYHIINRGNNHQVIFFRKDDYESFLDSLELAKNHKQQSPLLHSKQGSWISWRSKEPRLQGGALKPLKQF